MQRPEEELERTIEIWSRPTETCRDLEQAFRDIRDLEQVSTCRNLEQASQILSDTLRRTAETWRDLEPASTDLQIL